MNASQELFQREKKLCEWWTTVKTDARFLTVLLYARAACMEQGMSADTLKGAQSFESLLLHISDAEDKNAPYPSPGLVHDIDDPRGELKHTETKAEPPKD